MFPVDTVLIDGWADRPAPGLLPLTPGGRQRLTDVAARVDAFRDLSMAGISLEEYRTTVRTLERMSHNLEIHNTTQFGDGEVHDVLPAEARGSHECARMSGGKGFLSVVPSPATASRKWGPGAVPPHRT